MHSSSACLNSTSTYAPVHLWFRAVCGRFEMGTHHKSVFFVPLLDNGCEDMPGVLGHFGLVELRRIFAARMGVACFW